MYRHGGSTSFRRESRLAECWCHLHTVAQTVSLSPAWYPIGERVYLSIDPGRRPGLVLLLEPAASLVLTGGVESANRHLAFYEARKGSGLGTDLSPRRKDRPRLNRRQ